MSFVLRVFTSVERKVETKLWRKYFTSRNAERKMEMKWNEREKWWNKEREREQKRGEEEQEFLVISYYTIVIIIPFMMWLNTCRDCCTIISLCLMHSKWHCKLYLFCFWFVLFCFLPLVSNPPTIQPSLGTTQSSNDAFDDDNSDEGITDDNEINIINTVDKCNEIFLILDFYCECRFRVYLFCIQRKNFFIKNLQNVWKTSFLCLFIKALKFDTKSFHLYIFFYH